MLFSERMATGRLERTVSTSPPISFSKSAWSGGNTVRLIPEEPFHRDTTYVVTIRGGFRDYHRVANEKSYRFAFATGAAIDSGQVTGQVLFRREPSPKAKVRCYRLPVDSSFAFATTKPDREVNTNESGEFTLDYLPTNNQRFLVWAFHDANNDGVFDPDQEAGMAIDDTLVTTATSPVLSGHTIGIVDPREPTTVSGTVDNQSGWDTPPVTVMLLRADTSLVVTHATRVDTLGAYEFGRVLLGDYLLRALVDVDGDSTCSMVVCPGDSTQQCAEPCVTLSDTLRVVPGEPVTVAPIILNKP